MATIHIAGRPVGTGQPCLIIAEAGVNHNGDVEMAHRMIDAAVEAGADGVKFQAFVTEELVTPEAPKADYQVETTGGSENQYAMLKALELAPEHLAALERHCDEVGVLFICTPYDVPSVESLDRIGVAAIKVASTDTNNTPFLTYMATKGRPVILSTGMSLLADVEAAVGALAAVADKLAILHCTSEYPAPAETANLRAMGTLARAFACPVGYSDHSAGIGVAPWAVAAGAHLIEKHFTLDRTLEGPDHRASVEPEELGEMVRTVHLVEAALGDGVKRPVAVELRNKPRMQKSVVARRPIAAGAVIAAADLAIMRPGTGLAPKWSERIVGRHAATNIAAGAVLTLANVEWSEGTPTDG